MHFADYKTHFLYHYSNTARSPVHTVASCVAENLLEFGKEHKPWPTPCVGPRFVVSAEPQQGEFRAMRGAGSVSLARKGLRANKTAKTSHTVAV